MKFLLFNTIIIACIFVQFFINSLNLPTDAAIYPYILIPLIGFIGLSLTPSKAYSIKKHLLIFSLFTSTLLSIFYFQTNTLNEDYFFVIYSFRFYFGGIFMFLCLLCAYRSISIPLIEQKKSFLKFITFIILSNFSLCILELIYAKFSNTPAPWIPPERFDEDCNLIQSFFEAYRTYGFTGNCAVLGGFSVFLTTYYVSQVFNQIRLKEWIIIFSGIATIALSQSGTGFFLALISLIFLSFYSFFHKKYIFPLITFSGSIITFLYFAQTQFSKQGRFSLFSFEDLWTKHGVHILDYFQFIMDGDPYKFAFGALNFQKLSLQDVAHDQIANNTSLFDFAYIALIIETGFLGLFCYLGFYTYAIFSAFPNKIIPKSSFILLLLGSFHYGVSFWICSQVLSAAILAFHINYNQQKKYTSI